MGDICLFCCVFYRIDYDRSLSNVYTGDICFGMVCCPFHLVIRCTKCSTLVMVVNSHAFSLIACAVGVTSKNPLPSSEKSSTDFFPRFMFHLWNRDHWAHFCQWCNTRFNFPLLGVGTHFSWHSLSKTFYSTGWSWSLVANHETLYVRVFVLFKHLVFLMHSLYYQHTAYTFVPVPVLQHFKAVHSQ